MPIRRRPAASCAAAIPAGLSSAGLDGIAPTSRGPLLDAQKGFAFAVDTTQAKELALVYRLVNGIDGGDCSCAA